MNHIRNIKLLFAVLLNGILMAVTFTVIFKLADLLLLSILLPTLTHISVCGSLIYFIYISPAKKKKPAESDCSAMSYFAVPVSK